MFRETGRRAARALPEQRVLVRVACADAAAVRPGMPARVRLAQYGRRRAQVYRVSDQFVELVYQVPLRRLVERDGGALPSAPADGAAGAPVAAFVQLSAAPVASRLLAHLPTWSIWVDSVPVDEPSQAGERLK